MKRAVQSIAAERKFLAQLAELGVTLLEPGYLGSKVAHRARCVRGHDCAPRPNGLDQGRGPCKRCGLLDAWAPRKAEGEQRFRAKLVELGWEMLGEYVDMAAPVLIRCAKGHEVPAHPNNVLQGADCCTCAGRDSAATWRRFQERVAELGGTVLETEWLGTETPHRVQCAAGHPCSPRPHGVLQGQGICKRCADQRPMKHPHARGCEQRYRARLAELGATLLEPAYLGATKAHSVRCAVGHDWPSSPVVLLRAGNAGCPTCFETAREDEFTRKLETAGATLIERRPAGADGETTYRVQCRYGNAHTMRRRDLKQRHGDRVCDCEPLAGVERSRQRFEDRIAELGGTLIETRWLGFDKGHRAICPKGHPCKPRPSRILKSVPQSMCSACTGCSREYAETRFRELAAAAGAEILTQEWAKRTTVPIWIRCAVGHKVKVTPANCLNLGIGICSTCGDNAEWDILYVLANRSLNRVKFGITSTAASRARFETHRRAGYTEAVRLVKEIPSREETAALERHIKTTLRDGGTLPIQGREYFDISALALILDIVDHYPVGPVSQLTHSS